MFDLPEERFWDLAAKIQKHFQFNYSGDEVAWNGRTGIRFIVQQYVCTIVDTFPNGIRFAIDGVSNKTFYESYETLIRVEAIYL